MSAQCAENILHDMSSTMVTTWPHAYIVLPMGKKVKLSILFILLSGGISVYEIIQCAIEKCSMSIDSQRLINEFAMFCPT